MKFYDLYAIGIFHSEMNNEHQWWPMQYTNSIQPNGFPTAYKHCIFVMMVSSKYLPSEINTSFKKL